MVFMMKRYRISHTHSRGFISFQNTRKFCLNFVGCNKNSRFSVSQQAFPIWDFSKPNSLNALFELLFPTRVLLVGVREGFVQEEQQNPPGIPMTSATYVLADVSKQPGILTLNSVHLSLSPGHADIGSAASPSQSGSRAITSIIFEAVICDVDESCSVDTA